MADYRTQAAWDAYKFSGRDYADYIESHMLSLLQRGYLTEDEALGRTLSEALMGNEGG